MVVGSTGMSQVARQARPWSLPPPKLLMTWPTAFAHTSKACPAGWTFKDQPKLMAPALLWR